MSAEKRCTTMKYINSSTLFFSSSSNFLILLIYSLFVLHSLSLLHRSLAFLMIIFIQRYSIIRLWSYICLFTNECYMFTCLSAWQSYLFFKPKTYSFHSMVEKNVRQDRAQTQCIVQYCLLHFFQFLHIVKLKDRAAVWHTSLTCAYNWRYVLWDP